MGSTLGDVLGRLLLVALEYVMQRKDLSDKIRNELVLAMEKNAKEAYKWLAEHPSNSDDTPWRVREGGGKIKLQTSDSAKADDK